MGCCASTAHILGDLPVLANSHSLDAPGPPIRLAHYPTLKLVVQSMQKDALFRNRRRFLDSFYACATGEEILEWLARRPSALNCVLGRRVLAEQHEEPLDEAHVEQVHLERAIEVAHTLFEAQLIAPVEGVDAFDADARFFHVCGQGCVHWLEPRTVNAYVSGLALLKAQPPVSQEASPSLRAHRPHQPVHPSGRQPSPPQSFRPIPPPHPPSPPQPAPSTLRNASSHSLASSQRSPGISLRRSQGSPRSRPLPSAHTGLSLSVRRDSVNSLMFSSYNRRRSSVSSVGSASSPRPISVLNETKLSRALTLQHGLQQDVYAGCVCLLTAGDEVLPIFAVLAATARTLSLYQPHRALSSRDDNTAWSDGHNDGRSDGRSDLSDAGTGEDLLSPLRGYSLSGAKYWEADRIVHVNEADERIEASAFRAMNENWAFDSRWCNGTPPVRSSPVFFPASSPSPPDHLPGIVPPASAGSSCEQAEVAGTWYILHIETPAPRSSVLTFAFETPEQRQQWIHILDNGMKMVPSKRRSSLKKMKSRRRTAVARVSGPVDVLPFHVLLDTPQYRFDFARFCDDSFCGESMQCLDCLDAYTLTPDEAERKAQAELIFSLFLGHDSETPVNISDQTRLVVLDAMEEDRYPSNLMQACYVELSALLSSDVYPRYKAADRLEYVLDASNQDELRAQSFAWPSFAVIPLIEDVAALRDLVDVLMRSNVLKNRRAGLTWYKAAATGAQLVAWFLSNKYAPNKPAAIALGQRLVDARLLACFQSDADFYETDWLYGFVAIQSSSRASVISVLRPSSGDFLSFDAHEELESDGEMTDVVVAETTSHGAHDARLSEVPSSAVEIDYTSTTVTLNELPKPKTSAMQQQLDAAASRVDSESACPRCLVLLHGIRYNAFFVEVHEKDDELAMYLFRDVDALRPVDRIGLLDLRRLRCLFSAEAGILYLTFEHNSSNKRQRHQTVRLGFSDSSVQLLTAVRDKLRGRNPGVVCDADCSGTDCLRTFQRQRGARQVDVVETSCMDMVVSALQRMLRANPGPDDPE